MSGDIPPLPPYAYVVWIGNTTVNILSIYFYLFYRTAVTNSDNTASDTLKRAERIGSNVEGKSCRGLRYHPDFLLVR